jgi:type II secretory pathway pseudopilin PulG
MIRIFMNKKGFTLIETLIYSALLGMAITSFIAFALLISNLKNKNCVMAKVNVNARNALGLISEKIRQAEEIICPPQGTASSTLILKMPDKSLAIFKEQDNRLVLSELGSITNITSDRVAISDLNYTNLATIEHNDHIRTTFTIRYLDASSAEYIYQQSLQTAVSLRR